MNEVILAVTILGSGVASAWIYRRYGIGYFFGFCLFFALLIGLMVGNGLLGGVFFSYFDSWDRMCVGMKCGVAGSFCLFVPILVTSQSRSLGLHAGGIALGFLLATIVIVVVYDRHPYWGV